MSITPARVLILGDSSAKGCQRKTAFQHGELPAYPQLAQSALCAQERTTISFCGAAIRPGSDKCLLSSTQYVRYKKSVVGAWGSARCEVCGNVSTAIAKCAVRTA